MTSVYEWRSSDALNGIDFAHVTMKFGHNLPLSSYEFAFDLDGNFLGCLRPISPISTTHTPEQ